MTDKPLAKRKPNELRDLIEGADFRAQLLKALPKAMSPERFVRITVTSMMRNPKLLNCTRETFFRCLLDLSAMGLEPDARQAHLIPRKNKHTNAIDCTLVVDYKGLKELLYRNGDIIDEHSDVVGDMDFFEYEFGSAKHLTHKPNIHARGKIFCAYSYITLPKGGTTFDVMSTEEIEAVRKRSASPDSGPWVTDWAEMAKKTVFRRLSKSLPLSPKTRDAMDVDQTYDLAEPSPIATARTAVVGGRRELPPEPEEPEIGESSDEPGPQEPVGVPISPPEPVLGAGESPKPPGPLARVRKALKDAGFLPTEFVKLLQAVRLIRAEIKEIGQVPAHALEQALADWDNVLKRLELERANASNPNPQPVEPDDFPA
jgi:recombination protein RecT